MDHNKEQLPAISPLPEDREIVDEIRSEMGRLRQNISEPLVYPPAWSRKQRRCRR